MMLTFLRLNLLFVLEFDGVGVQVSAFRCSRLVPEGCWQNLLGVASALVLLDNLRDFVEQSSVQSDGIQAQVAEFFVGYLQFILLGLLTGVRDEVCLDTSHTGDHFGNITNTSGFGDLIKNFDTFSLGRGVVDGNVNAARGIGNVDKGTSLASSSVDSQRNTHGSLHEETIQDGSVVSVVVKSVDQTFIQDGLRSVGSPDNPLMQVGNSDLVVLIVELPEKSVETLGGVVDRSWVGRVQNGLFSASWKNNIQVSLRDFSSGGSVSVDTHGSQMHKVNIKFAVNDGTAQVVGTTNVVVNGVTLALGVLHGIRSCTLFGEVDNGIRLFVYDELDQQIVLFGDIQVHELDLLSTDFLPSIATILQVDR
jgi:hypothetical protein